MSDRNGWSPELTKAVVDFLRRLPEFDKGLGIGQVRSAIDRISAECRKLLARLPESSNGDAT